MVIEEGTSGAECTNIEGFGTKMKKAILFVG